MQRKKILITAVLFSIGIATMSGQSIENQATDLLSQGEESSGEMVTIRKFIPDVSPQTKAMIRYDNSSDVGNTGSFNYSVPLIHWEDPDFDFPINLNYSGTGFKPSEPDNFTGKDWSLACGGVIYRKVVGMPDDFLWDEDGSDYTQGFLSTIKQGSDKESIKDSLLYGRPEYLLGMWYSENVLALNYDNFKYEAASDIYHFNFGRHSGKFMIDYDGSILVYGNDGGHYDVDISGYELVSNTSNYTSTIRITTDDGYVYCFGGSYGSVEYNSLSWQTVVGSLDFDMTHKNTIVAFYLSKIIAPNGRELEISYMGEDIDRKFHELPELLMSDTYYDEIMRNNYHLYYSYSASPQDKLNLKATYLFGTLEGDDHRHQILLFDEIEDNQKKPLNNLNKCALISEVKTDDKRIVLSYSEREKSIYSHDDSEPFALKCGAQLNKISLYRGPSGPMIEESTLEYDLMNGLYPRLYLKSIDNSIEGKHSFAYNTVGVDPLTFNIDFWGYWRGGLDINDSLIPAIADSTKNDNLSYNVTSDYLGDIRQPLYNPAGATMLNCIEFPTGGKMEISYENHDYSTYFKKDLHTDYKKVLTDADINYPCGGARVKSIGFKHNGKSDKKIMYKYTKDEDSHLSSGILEYMPQYWHLNKMITFMNRSVFYPFFNSDGFNPNDICSPHLTYSAVTEYWTDSYEYRNIPPSHIEISPAEEDCTKEITVSAGNHQSIGIPDLDKSASLFSRWQILMDAENSSEASCRVIIRRTGDLMTVYDKVITGKRNEEFINPITEFGTGNYHVEISKSGPANVKFQTHYPECMDELLVNGPAVIRKYTDHHTNPDVYHYGKSFWGQTFLDPNQLLPDPVRDEEYYRNNFIVPENHSTERGKLLQQIYLSEDKDTVKVVNNRYKKCESGDVAVYGICPTVVSNIPCIANYANVNIERFYCYKPIETFETEYFGDGSKYCNKSTMTYDDWGYLIRAENEISSESSELTEFKYDIGGYPGLLTEEKYSKINGADTLEVKRVEYYYWANKLTGISEYCNDELTYSVSASRRDKYGNPIELYTSQGKKYTLLWGYKGKYMIAQIENADYREVRTVLGQDPINISDTGENILNTIDGLRLKLPHAKITTYRHNPLVGVYQITDESGQSHEYRYDDANRLNTELMINDLNQKILLNRYTYNIVNQ